MKDRWLLAAAIGLPGASSRRSIAVALALAVLSGCVSIRYQRPGRDIAPRAGETLVFGRVRFFHDGREFFPWDVSLVGPPVATQTERHLWLLRLGRRAVSAELHPDPDGSLAIWLASGDYALLGSTQLLTSGAPPYEVVALFRVPAGPVAAYTGELNMKTESHEGGHLSYSELGETSVIRLPIDIARVTLEQRLGRCRRRPSCPHGAPATVCPASTMPNSRLAPRNSWTAIVTALRPAWPRP